MSPMEFGTIKCKHCKGTGLDPHMDRDCVWCLGTGWLTPKRQKELSGMTDEQRPSGEEVVMAASDAIKPIVQDNEFSREALEKVVRSGRDKSKRRQILYDLYQMWPQGASSSQFEQAYGWLHQSCSSALTGLHQAGLVSVVSWRTNQRGSREGVYTLSAMAKGAWNSI